MRALLAVLVLLSGCRTLETKTVQISSGDSKDRVLQIMGTPGDRQFKEGREAWQYCITGAGFGYHDYRTIWFHDGVVTAITSYKDRTPGSGCTGNFRSIEWE